MPCLSPGVQFNASLQIHRDVLVITIGAEISQRSDGYLNATAMCKANGKKWAGYYRNANTDAFLNELEAVLRICRAELVTTIQGGLQIGRAPSSIPRSPTTSRCGAVRPLPSRSPKR